MAIASAVVGAVVGFLTGMALSTGPASVPVFTAYRLSGGAFLGTEEPAPCCSTEASW
jgi:hypothetical protein